MLTEGLCRGKAPAEIETLVKALSPEMQQTKAMQNMLAKASELKATKIGKLTSKIEGMRPCCGILDFSVNEKNEVLVANLGAFRVESYDFTGKKIVVFGSRGRNVSEFHGCCNPVSVAYLSNGAIITVEKDPTEVKVFSKEGAKMIEGVEELVK